MKSKMLRMYSTAKQNLKVQFKTTTIGPLTYHLVFPEAQRKLSSHSTIDLIRNPILNGVSYETEIQLLLATFKNWLTPNP